MTGESRGCSRAAAPVCGFSRGTTARSVSLSWGFPDEIGRYSYPIDIHPSNATKEAYELHRKEFDRLYRYRRGESYGIPYRILCAKGVRNLLVAGRCVSTDQKVQASIRVIPGCYITGQAAGMAAALAAAGAGDVHGVDVKALQRKLKEFGAYLPNA